MNDKLLYTPAEAAEALAIGRTRLYALLRSGEIRSIKLGTSRRIPAAALAEFADRLERTRTTASGAR